MIKLCVVTAGMAIVCASMAIIWYYFTYNGRSWESTHSNWYYSFLPAIIEVNESSVMQYSSESHGSLDALATEFTRDRPVIFGDADSYTLTDRFVIFRVNSSHVDASIAQWSNDPRLVQNDPDIMAHWIPPVFPGWYDPTALAVADYCFAFEDDKTNLLYGKVRVRRVLIWVYTDDAIVVMRETLVQ